MFTFYGYDGIAYTYVRTYVCMYLSLCVYVTCVGESTETRKECWFLWSGIKVGSCELPNMSAVNLTQSPVIAAYSLTC